jgi:hypothetical protein
MNNLTVGDTWEWALYLLNKADCADSGDPSHGSLDFPNQSGRPSMGQVFVMASVPLWM